MKGEKLTGRKRTYVLGEKLSGDVQGAYGEIWDAVDERGGSWIVKVAGAALRFDLYAELDFQQQRPQGLTSAVADIEDMGQWGRRVFHVRPPYDGSLHTWVTRERPSVVDRVHVAQQVLGVVARLHERDKVHRDIKPQNFLYLRYAEHLPPRVLVIDTALLREAEQEASPQTGRGTPLYQAWDALLWAPKVSRKVDVYAAALTCFFLLTGGHPASLRQDPESALTEEGRELRRLTLRGTPADHARREQLAALPPERLVDVARHPRLDDGDVAELCHHLPPGPQRDRLVQAFGRALAPLPAHRAPGLTELSDALRDVALTLRPPAARQAAPWVPDAAFPVPQPSPPRPVVPSAGGALRRHRVALAAGLLLLLGSAGWAAWTLLGEAPRGGIVVQERPPVSSPPPAWEDEGY